jgi:putative urate catabolism protein
VRLFSQGPPNAFHDSQKDLAVSAHYPRDMIGYGATPPHPHWPGEARIALSFVLNYEEGGERNILHGDPESEAFLSEMVAAQPLPGARNMSMESLYEYGSRAGVWRILDLFKTCGIPLTVFAVAMAAQRHPEVIRAMVAAGHEICSHGYRWIDYQSMDEAEEREHVRQAIRILTEISGERPLGWYTGRTGPNTRRLVMEEGGFLYDSDSYDDDLPYWAADASLDKPHLVIPYTLDTNDMRFTQVQGFNTGEDFFLYLKDAFDVLYAEGAQAPKMLSIGLHCRLIGRPGRLASLKRFLAYVQSFEQVWFARRVDIARHWHATHPPRPSDPAEIRA